MNEQLNYIQLVDIDVCQGLRSYIDVYDPALNDCSDFTLPFSLVKPLAGLLSWGIYCSFHADKHQYLCNSVFLIKHTVMGFLHVLETGAGCLEQFCSNSAGVYSGPQLRCVSAYLKLLFDLRAKSYFVFACVDDLYEILFCQNCF